MSKILVVDDEVGIRELLSEILYDEGHTVELAENAGQARAARLRACPDLVLLDIWMPDTDGISLLKEWSSQGLLNMPVIMMSGHATIDTATEAARIGAIDFLEKPITLQKLLKAVKVGLARGTPLHPRAMPTIAPVAPTPAAASKVRPTAPEPESTAVAHREGYLGSIALDQPLREARDAFERIYLEYHLNREQSSMTRISEKTGLERTHLYRKMKQLGMDTRRK